MIVLIADDDTDWHDLATTWVASENDTREVKTRIFDEPSKMLEVFTTDTTAASHAVIFLDLQFDNHGINGLDTLKLIKEHQDDRIRNVPVVIYSGSSSPEEIDESYANKANSFVHKGDGDDRKDIFLDTVRFWMQTAKLPS